MSPASYRAAPPRVGEPKVTGRPPLRPNRARCDLADRWADGSGCVAEVQAPGEAVKARLRAVGGVELGCVPLRAADVAEGDGLVREGHEVVVVEIEALDCGEVLQVLV